MSVSPVLGTGVIPSAGSITNELTSVTRRAFIPKLVVQIYQAAPSLNLCLRNAQRAAGGVNQITVPLQGAPMTQFSWTSYLGTFPIPQVQTALQNAQWNISMGVVPIQVLGMESMTQSTEAVIPLLKARMADSYDQMVLNMATALFGSNSSNSLAMNGFQDVYDNGTAAPMYGGVDRTQAANSFWKSTIYSTGFQPSRNTMLTRLTQTQSLAGGEVADLVLMSLSDWTTLTQDFMSAEQFRTAPGMKYGKDDSVNAGFTAVMVGNTPILADPYCPKGTAYVINTKYLGFYISEWANFSLSEFHSLVPNGQLGHVALMLTGMALACTKPVTGMQCSNLTGGAF